MNYTRVKTAAYHALDPLVTILVQLGINPNAVTAAGFGFCVLAGISYGFGRFIWALVFLLFGGLCDMVDGSVARRQGRSNKWGAFFDSSLDRYSEVFIFGGILLYFLIHDPALWKIVLVYLSLGGSLMISYTRARAEGVGIQCKVGILQRQERIVLLLIGTLIGGKGFEVILLILAVFTHVTAIQRIMYIRRKEGMRISPDAREERGKNE
jgi:CDP-diacylglycerol--glycerol-3-phosphate 3-phosphatidyltransferase